MEKFGIENLKIVLAFGIGLGQHVASASQGGINWQEALGFVPELMQIPEIAKKAPLLKEEIADLSDEESDQLKKFIADKFDLENDKTEAAIEHAANLVLDVVGLVNVFKKTEDAPAK